MSGALRQIVSEYKKDNKRGFNSDQVGYKIITHEIDNRIETLVFTLPRVYSIEREVGFGDYLDEILKEFESDGHSELLDELLSKRFEN